MSDLKDSIDSSRPIDNTVRKVHQIINSTKTYVLDKELVMKDQFMELLQLTLFINPEGSRAPKHFAKLQFLKTVTEVDTATKMAYKECKDVIAHCARVKVVHDRLTDKDKEVLGELDDKINEYFNTFDERNFWTYGKANVEELLTRVDLFGRAIMEFRFWDTWHNIDLFADTLIETGKYIRKNGHCVNNERRGRECMAAGGMLKKAYADDIPNTTWNYYYEQAKERNTKRPLIGNIEAASNHPDRARKILNIAMKREYRAEHQRKVDAWNNIVRECSNKTGDLKHTKLEEWWD